MDPTLLLIILFLVAPLIERLLKAGKQEPPEGGPGRRPPGELPDRHPSDTRGRFPSSGERVELPRPRSGAGTGGGAEGSAGRHPRDEDAAADMLPDDLWEILTGERRSPPPTRPPADDEYLSEEEIPGEVIGYESEVPDEELADEEQHDPARFEWYEPRQLPAPARAQPVPVHEAPQVVSLEKLTYDSEKRHRQFHAKVDAMAGPARVQRRRKPIEVSADLATQDDLRRAVILAEVLGPPKGLQ